MLSTRKKVKRFLCFIWRKYWGAFYAHLGSILWYTIFKLILLGFNFICSFSIHFITILVHFESTLFDESDPYLSQCWVEENEKNLLFVLHLEKIPMGLNWVCEIFLPYLKKSFKEKSRFWMQKILIAITTLFTTFSFRSTNNPLPPRNQRTF